MDDRRDIDELLSCLISSSSVSVVSSSSSLSFSLKQCGVDDLDVVGDGGSETGLS